MKPSYSNIRFLFYSARMLADFRRELRFWLNPPTWADAARASDTFRACLDAVRRWRICYRNDLAACLR